MTITTVRRIAIALTIGVVSLAGLSACTPLVISGVAGAGMMATDRRSSGIQIDDQSIELRGALRIHDIANDDMNVSVTSYNRQVLLTGTVGSDADKRKVEDVIRHVDPVRKVFNEVEVGSGSSFSDRSNDTFITSKVKASMLDQHDIFANSFKVVTERGVVYLMGIATRKETDNATEIARNITGVQKVVRLVEIISEQELADLEGRRPSFLRGRSESPPPTSSSSSRVPLPPMEPLPPPTLSSGSPLAPDNTGVVTTPVR
jgi:osmotically-inducible protein OsmY